MSEFVDVDGDGTPDQVDFYQTADGHLVALADTNGDGTYDVGGYVDGGGYEGGSPGDAYWDGGYDGDAGVNVDGSWE